MWQLQKKYYQVIYCRESIQTVKANKQTIKKQKRLSNKGTIRLTCRWPTSFFVSASQTEVRPISSLWANVLLLSSTTSGSWGYLTGNRHVMLICFCSVFLDKCSEEQREQYLHNILSGFFCLFFFFFWLSNLGNICWPLYKNSNGQKMEYCKCKWHWMKILLVLEVYIPGKQSSSNKLATNDLA